jgi:hypothetical protein
MMTEAFSGNVEMAIVLPLSVVSHQLLKIESELRLLNMKALHVDRQRDHGHHTQLINARLETINASLDSIRDLVAELGADIPRKRTPERDD